MKVFIDASKTVKKLHNFWNHIHFHPTDAIEDDWGREILDNVARDNVAQTVRMYAMLEDIVTMDESGNLKYDFTLNDQRMDYMVSKGFNLLVSYNFMPPCISSDPDELATVCKNKTRYKGKFIITAEPKDFSLWEEVCYKYTEHIVERYGINEVSKWYLQCFNEPDISWFYMKKCKDMEKRIKSYCKLYDAFERGVCRVSEKLKIGGPALAREAVFLDGFLKHIKENNRKIDYICFHAYGTVPAAIENGEKPLSVYNIVNKVLRVHNICKNNGFESLPLIIDEWGASGIGFLNIDDFPSLIFRENEVYSAYFARLIMACNAYNLPLDKILICLSGQHELCNEFSGFRGFFTLSGFKKPIYNAYALAAKLGDSQLHSITVLDDDTLNVLPTKFEDGHIAIMFVYSSEHFDRELSDLNVELKLDGIEGKSYKLWTIDGEKANGYSAFKRLGYLEPLTGAQKEEIAKLSENCYTEGKFTPDMEFTIKNNGVILLEVF